MASFRADCVDPRAKETKEDQDMHHIVVVGAGISGLTCASELLAATDANVRITLLEASDRIGGRIRGTAIKNTDIMVDLGAEYIHGYGTMLTKFIDDARKAGKIGSVPRANDVDEDNAVDNDGMPLHGINELEFFEPQFITSHADGGGRPDPRPTVFGKYGMYFVGGKLYDTNDPYVEELATVFDSCLYDDEEKFDENNRLVHDDYFQSIRDGIMQEDPLSEGLYDLAIAGYGNTAGCSDLSQLSLSMLKRFENYWDENEGHGDYCLPSNIGMTGVMKAMVDKIESPRCNIYLNWKAGSIEHHDSSNTNGLTANSPGVVIRRDGDASEVISADAVIVTIPPPMYDELQLELPVEKKQALKYIGFERVVKFVLRFSSRVWPHEHLQNMVCADSVAPEIWFREIKQGNETIYLVCCFIVSDTADDLIAKIEGEDDEDARETKAAGLVMDQLAEMFGDSMGITKESLADDLVETMFFDWAAHPSIRGGYMFPRVGLTPIDLEALAAPMHGGRICFAGEATNVNACCTVQAAMETGARAAKEALESLNL